MFFAVSVHGDGYLIGEDTKPVSYTLSLNFNLLGNEEKLPQTFQSHNFTPKSNLGKIKVIFSHVSEAGVSLLSRNS